MISNILTFIGLVYLGILIGLYFFQRSILYLPAKSLEGPKYYGMKDIGEVELITKDKVKIYAWYSPPKDNEPVMVYFHGNAGNLSNRAEKFKRFQQKNLGLLAVSYRGYGKSNGSPTEEGLYLDAKAAIEYLLSYNIALDDIILYGESLGSGVAVEMATKYKVRAVILEAPYTSIVNRASQIYPYIPVRYLIHDKFESIKKLDKVNSPILIFHGYRDDVVPISHGRKMLHAAKEPKEARFFNEVGHTDFDYNDLVDVTYKFIHKKF